MMTLSGAAIRSIPSQPRLRSALWRIPAMVLGTLAAYSLLSNPNVENLVAVSDVGAVLREHRSIPTLSMT